MGKIENEISALKAREIVEGKDPTYYSNYLNKIFENIKDNCCLGKTNYIFDNNCYTIPIGVVNYLKSLGYNVDYIDGQTTKISITW